MLQYDIFLILYIWGMGVFDGGRGQTVPILPPYVPANFSLIINLYLNGYKGNPIKKSYCGKDEVGRMQHNEDKTTCIVPTVKCSCICIQYREYNYIIIFIIHEM